MYNYHQSIKPSELIYRPKQTCEDALKPPWSLNLKTTIELKENAEKTIPEAFSSRRTQSAPTVRPAPTHRIILKIPTPQLQNLFDGEAEECYDNDERNILENSYCQSDIDTNNHIKISELIPLEQYKLLNLNQSSDIIITNSTSNLEEQSYYDDRNEHDQTKKVTVVPNYGKKSLIIDEKPKELIRRPKTSNTNFRRTKSSSSVRGSLKERPKTSIIKSRITTQSTYGSLNDPEDAENTINLHQIINSHTVQQQDQQQQNYYKHFSNKNKSSQNLDKQNEQTVVYVDPHWVDNYLNAKSKMRNDVKVVDGNWKDQMINRRFVSNFIFYLDFLTQIVSVSTLMGSFSSKIVLLIVLKRFLLEEIFALCN